MVRGTLTGSCGQGATPMPSSQPRPPAASDSIRFVLNGEVTAIRHIAPTRTVLNFLREDLGKPGTKEGCAEGDCGTCTVVIGALRGDRLVMKQLTPLCSSCLPSTARHCSQWRTCVSLTARCIPYRRRWWRVTVHNAASARLGGCPRINASGFLGHREGCRSDLWLAATLDVTWRPQHHGCSKHSNALTRAIPSSQGGHSTA